MNSFPVETRDICGLYRMRWKGSLCADIDNAGLGSCSFFLTQVATVAARQIM